MAYGLIYTHPFKQLTASSPTDEYLIKIYKEGYVGSDSEITCTRGSITMSRDGGLLENVQGTTLSIGIENQTEGQFKEFREAGWGDYKVELIADPNGAPVTKFVGYNQSEIYTEPYDQPPYTSSIEFTDGLSHLKHVRWQDDSGEVSETGVDANDTATVSASLKLDGASNGVRVKIDANTGDQTNHIVTLQRSVDDIVWTNTDRTIQGSGFELATADYGTDYVRLKVTTAEAAASTIDWSLTPIYVGQKTIIEVLRLALNKLPSPLKIREFVNIYEDSINSTTTDSMLNQIYVSADVYKEVKEDDGSSTEITAFFCNQVIEEILKPFNAHIYQWDGIWYIIRPQEYLDSTMYYREFNANVGTESTVTVDATGNWTTNTRTVTGKNGLSTELILVAPSSEMSIEVPLNRVQVTYNQKNLDVFNNDLITNGCFEEWVVPIATLPNQTYPAYWDLFGVDYISYDTKIGDDWFTFEPTAQATAGTFNALQLISQRNFGVVTATTDSLQFSLDFKFVWSCQKKAAGTANGNLPTFLYNDLYVRYEVKIIFGTYYLSGDPDNGYSWVTADSRATFEQVGMEGTFGTYVANGDVETTITTTLPTLPQTAQVDFQIIIYRPYSNFDAYKQTISSDYNVSFISLGTKCISLVYLPDEENPVEELILHSEIEEDENVEELEVIHGDGTNTISVNSFRISSGLITDSWSRRGAAETEEILPLLLLQLRDLRGEFKKNLSASLIGEFEAFNTIEDTTDVTTEYYINDYTWAVETNEWDCNLMELITSAATITTNTTVGTNDVKQETNNVGGSEPSEPPLESKVVQSSTTLQPEQLSLNGYI